MRTLPAIAILALAPASLAQYALDDGSGGSNIGPSTFDAEMLWGNYFDAVPGAETITGVQISFSSSLPAGLDLTLLVFDDPDDDLDPRNAHLLATTSALTQSTGPQDFASYAVPATTVSGGFFVAAILDLPAGQPAARLDADSNVGRSWTFFDGTINTGALGDSPLFFGPNGTGFPGATPNPFPGAYMLRATGVPTPGVLALAPCALLCARRRR